MLLGYLIILEHHIVYSTIIGLLVILTCCTSWSDEAVPAEASVRRIRPNNIFTSAAVLTRLTGAHVARRI